MGEGRAQQGPARGRSATGQQHLAAATRGHDVGRDLLQLPAELLELDLGLSNVCLAAAAAGNLLCLADLVPDSLIPCQSLFRTFHVSVRTSALKSSNG